MPQNADRPDVHNNEIDVSLAALGLCGMTHLYTGHVCRLPERHPGGCDFVHRRDIRTG
ncbi:hypothetical protein [uncultured Jatrophihabitans sp.]|uniref:hypothetical protein n=1 Tax=uncultured Jatrophihabitans sp. TaxID=1610747 RepID=UPI0035CA11A0